MKSVFLVLSLILAVNTANAQGVSTTTLDKLYTPFKTKVMQRLYKMDDVSAGSAYATQEGTFHKRVTKAFYDVATDGGAIGAHPLGVFLPAKAVITQAYFMTDVQFVDAGAGTVALQCEDAGNIFAAADITGFTVGTMTSGVATGTAATMIKNIAATCELQAVVAGIAQTAGKLTLWVEYVVQL